MKILFVLIIALLLIIHIAVFIGWIPYTTIWGGRLKSRKEMFRFETISIGLNILFLWLVLESTAIVKGILPQNWNLYILYFIGGFFTLNVLANLFSRNKIEKIIFTPLAVILAFCAFYLAVSL